MAGNASAADIIFGTMNSPVVDSQPTVTTEGGVPDGASSGTGTIGAPVAGAAVMRRGAGIVIGAALILVLFGTVLFKEARLG